MVIAMVGTGMITKRFDGSAFAAFFDAPPNPVEKEADPDPPCTHRVLKHDAKYGNEDHEGDPSK